MGKGRGWAALVVAAGLGVAACGGGTSTSAGDGAIKSVDVAALLSGNQQPLDAAPSPDGAVIYFTAIGDSGPAVSSVPAAGGTVRTIAQGAPLAKPTGVAVSTDGSRLFVADAQAVLTVPSAAASAPSVLPGTQGRAPHGLDVANRDGADVVYFTGTDPANGAHGLFQVPAAGGAVTIVAEGAPFASPDSVVVDAKGVAYVSDQGTGPGHGQVLRVSGATVTPVLTGLTLGNPAGVTLANNETTLLVSSIDAATTSDQVLFLDLASGKTSTTTKVIGANKSSSGGLHRAANASVLAWADVSRSGRVYRVEP